MKGFPRSGQSLDASLMHNRYSPCIFYKPSLRILHALSVCNFLYHRRIDTNSGHSWDAQISAVRIRSPIKSPGIGISQSYSGRPSIWLAVKETDAHCRREFTYPPAWIHLDFCASFNLRPASSQICRLWDNSESQRVSVHADQRTSVATRHRLVTDKVLCATSAKLPVKLAVDGHLDCEAKMTRPPPTGASTGAFWNALPILPLPSGSSSSKVWPR